MSYHRTTGKGGTVNSSRHPKLPNFNKSTSGGYTKKPSSGKVKKNPGKH